MSRFLFYGLYTWLVHTAFGLPVSILPAVLAAVAGAIPFIGPYWIALPAILELWLVEGEAVSAIAVLVLSLIPLFFIDSIIYGEVEGGHPYLTGLAHEQLGVCFMHPCPGSCSMGSTHG
jgi:predicted PurR-regulated permease PerM